MNKATPLQLWLCGTLIAAAYLLSYAGARLGGQITRHAIGGHFSLIAKHEVLTTIYHPLFELELSVRGLSSWDRHAAEWHEEYTQDQAEQER